MGQSLPTKSSFIKLLCPGVGSLEHVQSPSQICLLGSFKDGWIGTGFLTKGPLLIGIILWTATRKHVWLEWMGSSSEWPVGSIAAVIFCRIPSWPPRLSHSDVGTQPYWVTDVFTRRIVLISLLVLIRRLNVHIMESRNISTINWPQSTCPDSNGSIL